MCSCDIIEPRRQRVPCKKLPVDCSKTCTTKLHNEAQPKTGVKPGQINLTIVQQTVRGRIQELFENHGFISYKLDQKLLKSTIDKNGASCLPINDGKIFFYRNEVSGGIASLILGQTVEFDLVHLKANNKIIAVRVNGDNVDDIPLKKHAKTALSHFQFMEPAKMTEDIPVSSLVKIAANIQGVICKLVPSNRIQNCGFLAIDNQKYAAKDESHIFFHDKDLYQLQFSQLKEGQKVVFDLYQSIKNKKYMAKQVTKNPISPVTADQLNLAKKILATSSVKSGSCDLKKTVTKKIVPRPRDRSLIEKRGNWEARRGSVETLSRQSKPNFGSR